MKPEKKVSILKLRDEILKNIEFEVEKAKKKFNEEINN
jgi:hypothetical protein